MNPFSLAVSSIRSRALTSALCIIAAASGIALLCAVVLLFSGVHQGLMRNARGIDLVIGAKGSPLQLILSTIYHADVPNGNIETKDAEKLLHNPHIARAIPLALGDNYKGWRIVGTTPDYPALYRAQLHRGQMFAQPFDAVAGALTGVKMGERFPAVHGLSIDSDDVHNYHLFQITGVLKPTGTVLDRLILTSVGSVQELHKHPDLGDPDAAEEYKIGHQLTALLVKTRSPIDIMNLPREINQSSILLAAAPGYEMTRFSTAMGFGREIITYLAVGFIALSALALLSTLAASLAARRYDLGVMRVLGASPAKLLAAVISEGMILGGSGAILGALIGHILAWAIALDIPTLQGLMVPSSLLMPDVLDIGLIGLGLGVGLLAALIPAISAARTDVAAILARGRA